MNIERNLLSLGLAALLAACSADDSRLGTSSSGRSVFIASATVSNPATRATGTSVVIEKGSMGLYRSKGTGYTSALNNLEYTYSPDAGWQPATATDTLLLNGDNADVCAYYPYHADETYTDPTTIPLQSGKYVGTADMHDPADLCYDINREVNAYQRSTTFALEHAMALLEIEISTNTGFRGDGKLSRITLQNPELITQSSINITNRTYSTSPVKGSVAFPFSGTVTTTTTNTVAALLVPFIPSTEGVTVALTMDNIHYTFNILTTDVSAFAAGTRYRLQVMFNETAFQVTNVSRLPWIESGVGGDDYAYYPVEEKSDYEITLGTEVTIGNNTWATANLRTSDAGDSNFEFEANPWISGRYPEEKLVDDIEDPTKMNLCYWNWGCLKTPYDTPFLAGDNEEWGKTEDGTLGDPCAKIPGNEWRVPSKAQLEDLSQTIYRPKVNETVWMHDEVFTVTNASGWVENDNKTIQGQVFVAADGKAIFLPAAGYRTDYGGMRSWGVDGEYCSRTPDYELVGYNQCIDLFFYNGYCNVGSNYRNTGKSVRCVKGN